MYCVKSMEASHDSFISQATHDVLPSLRNLKQWYGKDPICPLCWPPSRSVSHLKKWEAWEMDVYVGNNCPEAKQALGYLGQRLDWTPTYEQHLHELKVRTSTTVSPIHHLAGLAWGESPQTLCISTQIFVLHIVAIFNTISVSVPELKGGAVTENCLFHSLMCLLALRQVLGDDVYIHMRYCTS